MNEEAILLLQKAADIKELLESYKDECASKACFYEDECTRCLRGNCKDCAQPEWDEADRCYKIISLIEDYLEEAKISN